MKSLKGVGNNYRGQYKEQKERVIENAERIFNSLNHEEKYIEYYKQILIDNLVEDCQQIGVFKNQAL